MNRPSSMLGSTFDNLNPQSSPSTSNQQQQQYPSSSLPHPTTSHQQSPPTQHHFPYYPSNVHLPAGSTYIGHYRKY